MNDRSSTEGIKRLRAGIFEGWINGIPMMDQLFFVVFVTIVDGNIAHYFKFGLTL